MKVECVPLTSFVHGSLDVKEGRPHMIEESTAKDLERAGLVRIRTEPVAKAKSGIVGKGSDDGQGQTSSASHPAPALSEKTSGSSSDGKSRTPRGGK